MFQVWKERAQVQRMPTMEKNKKGEEIEKSRRRKGGAYDQATKGTARGEASASHQERSTGMVEKFGGGLQQRV